jgi:hypothetical protein
MKKPAKPVQVVARVPAHVKAALDTIKVSQGISIQHQITRALVAWVKSQGFDRA